MTQRAIGEGTWCATEFGPIDVLGDGVAAIFSDDYRQRMAFQYSISLQVWHPSIKPDDIEQLLFLEAKNKAAKGEPRQTPNGTILDGNYRENFCNFALAYGEDGKLADALSNVCADLMRCSDEIVQLKTSGGRLNFFIWLDLW